jgi:1-acyl-sn-glycerol-3-phosphate acyltransferase
MMSSAKNGTWVSAIDKHALKQTCRAAFLITASLALATVVALAMLLVAFVTLFRARRFYQEVMTTWLGRVILWLWRVRLEVHQDEPFPTTQTMYISNHTSTLDVFILIALGLPNTRFFIFSGTRKWLPLAVIGYLIGNFFTPPQTIRADRVRCFERAERILRRTGSSVYLSPEGARITTGHIGPFNKAAFHLATNLQVPIVPLYINTPRDIDPGKGFATRPGTVPVYVKPRISTRGWRLEDLERNREMVRGLYLDFHRTHQRG